LAAITGKNNALTVLPIVERELRVRARSAAGYWTRFAVGLIALVMTVPAFVSPVNFRSAAHIGPLVFHWLVGTAFVLCCGASLLTADVISRERREGTLGLLLLTRVRGFDVLFGKLSSAGIASVGGLVALLPVLMIPILAGGVTGGEVARESVALLNTLFFALAIGLWGSTSQIERARAVRVTVVTFIAISILPILLHLFLTDTPLQYVEGATPLVTIMAASEGSYQSSAAMYWDALVLAPFGNPVDLAYLIVVLLPSVAVFFFYVWIIRSVRRRLALEFAGTEV